MRRFLHIVLALALAGGATLLIHVWLEEQKRLAFASVQPETIVLDPDYVEVLVAAERLVPGSFVKPGALRWQKWPDVEMPEGYIRRGRDDETAVEGSVVRQALMPGDPVMTTSLVRPGDRGFLAAVLDPGMRAVSVPVDEASSNAGLIFPGDRVDLLLSQTLADTIGAGGRRRVSETVLENLRVIAMGRRLHSAPEEDAAANPVRTVTLEVTPAGAEVVALVTELGKLSLSLRSIAYADAPSEPLAVRRGVTWDSDISHVLGSEGRTGSPLQVIRGTARERIMAAEGSQE